MSDAARRRIGLGIDTGGTYTDAVLIDMNGGEVLSKGKALTTRRNLTVGLSNAVKLLDHSVFPDVALVSISSTLATNSVVEGKGCRVALIACGRAVDKTVPLDYSTVVAGGHTIMGDERHPLDVEAAKQFILDTRDLVDAYAVSSYLSVRNPEHEIALKSLVQELTTLPVVCGRELSGELGFQERTITAVLNARLISVMRQLIDSAERALAGEGVHAPLVIVKGDGGLMNQASANDRPVETVLSGPAASVIGAKYLTGKEDAIVIDIGGTTSDIAILRGGIPYIDPEGATVGKWKTRVRACDVLTAGIGGDSRVVVHDKKLHLAPQRVVPLCIAAAEYPSLVEMLQRAAKIDFVPPYSYQARQKLASIQTNEFFIPGRLPEGLNLADPERRLLDLIQQGPVNLYEAAERLGIDLYSFRIDWLEGMGVVLRIGVTPTDALHVEGTYRRYDAEASRLGVAILARRLHVDEATFAHMVNDAVVTKIAKQVVIKLLSDQTKTHVIPDCHLCEYLIDGPARNAVYEDFTCAIHTSKALIGVGAPANIYLPEVARRLNTSLVVPEHAEVANAVGAIMGNVLETVEIMVEPLPGFSTVEDPAVIVCTPSERREFEKLSEAIEYAIATGSQLATALAVRAGATGIEVRHEREDRFATLPEGWGRDPYLETRLVFRAMGKPNLLGDAAADERLTTVGSA